MRSCIYCGRELEQGEVCNCPQGAAYRAQKNASASNRANTKDKSQKKSGFNQNPYKTETSYKTGYAGKESRFERFKTKYKTKRAARKSTVKTGSAKNFFSGLFRYILDFLKSPVDKITNPSHLSKAGILTIAAVQGAVLWLCIFFILNGGAMGPFKILASVMTVGISTTQNLLVQALLSAISGAISGIILFFLYSGIFYLINRFIMRLKTAYWEFSIRLAATWIPFTVICAVGTLLSMLSPITLAVLLMCGAVSVAVLTYEALKTEWFSCSPSKVMYAMLLGYFVFFTVVCCLITI